MNQADLQDILQSDMKLWESATQQEGKEGSLTLAIDLPYGIGIVEVTFEGIKDAGTRRGAVESWGNYIRGQVEDKTSDEAIAAKAARAKMKLDDAAAARGGDLSTPQPAVPAAAGQVILLDDVPQQIDLIREAIKDLTVKLHVLKRQLAGLEAYLEVFDGTEVGHESENSTTSKTDTS